MRERDDPDRLRGRLTKCNPQGEDRERVEGTDQCSDERTKARTHHHGLTRGTTLHDNTRHTCSEQRSRERVGRGSGQTRGCYSETASITIRSLIEHTDSLRTAVRRTMNSCLLQCSSGEDKKDREREEGREATCMLPLWCSPGRAGGRHLGAHAGALACWVGGPTGATTLCSDHMRPTRL